MAHPTRLFVGLLALAALAGCGAGQVPAAPQSVPVPSAAPFVTDARPESESRAEGDSGVAKDEPAVQPTVGEENTMLYITIGKHTLAAVLEENPSARALAAMLEEGPLTINAENYGGFEKVGVLPKTLPRDDAQTTARPGDVMLYQGDSIVLFYGSNRWAYTRLARIADTEGLEGALSGSETSLTLSLEP